MQRIIRLVGLPVFMASASRCFLYLILLFLLLPVSDVVAQEYRNVTLGSSLTASLDKNSSWRSPTGDFAFGFRQIEAGMFLLAIWFDNIPEKTIIWSAEFNGGNLVREGAKIELASDGKFTLSDSGGKQTWEAAPLSGSGTVSYAAMLDTGNFVLVSSQDSNSLLWESFSKPTDTIVPTQIMKQNTLLGARYAEMNYSDGRFELQMQADGNLVFYPREFPLHSRKHAYWASNTMGSNSEATFYQSGDINVVEAKNRSILENVTSSGVSSKDYYQRAILEYDGVFRHYVYPKNRVNNAAWSLRAYVPENICKQVGPCGRNSYCVQGDDNRTKCECPPGYSHEDPDNKMNGCKQDFVPQECNGGQEAAVPFSLREIAETNWPYNEYESFRSVEEDWCRQSCLTDCFCAAAIFDNKGCYKKSIPLIAGYQDSSFKGKTMMKIRTANSTAVPTDKGSTPSTPLDMNKSSLDLILTTLLSSSAFLNLALLIAILWIVSCLCYRPRRMVQNPIAVKGTGLQSFTYKQLEEAADKFKEELGKGACSTVYKAVLNGGDGRTSVAVKRLDKMVTDSEQEFQAEMNAIGKTNHKNLVQLLGFCNEGQHRILVYEYMSNGSLASYLFGDSRPSWYRRAEIAVGTARGLVYLHEECSNRIVHCDIKPHNILLDDNLTARISDFGLAKLLKTDQTRTLTAIRGTKGYVAPEWFKNMPITVKVDIYSFGILLLELICCRKSFDQNVEDESQMILAHWAYDCYEEGRLRLLIQDDKEAIEDVERIEKFVMISLWCIQEDPLLRPTMRRVSQMLEGAAEVPPPPKSPH